MANWLPPKKAAQALKGKNKNMRFSETTIRRMIDDGFPYIPVGNRKLIDVDAFYENLSEYAKLNAKREQEGITTKGIRRIAV